MVWQKIDDQFGISKKVIRIPRNRRHQCAGLWLLALNYAGRALTDGVLEEHELEELSARTSDVNELVRVDLWHAHGHDCERCVPVPDGSIIIHDFLVYNPSRAKVESDREAERVRKASQRDKKRIDDGTGTGVRGVSEHPVPSPSRSRKTDDGDTRPPVTEVDAGDADETGFIAASAAELGIRSMPRVRVALERVVGYIVDDAVLIDLSRRILLLASSPVKSAEAYIETACMNSPVEVRTQWEAVSA